MGAVGDKQLVKMMLDENFERLPVLVYAFPVLALVVVYALAGTIPSGNLAVWCGLVLVAMIVNLGLGRGYRDQRARYPLATWAKLRVLSSGYNAAVWGVCAATILYPAENWELKMFIVFLVGGTCAAAVTSSASYLPAFAVYEVVSLVPIIVRLLLEGDAAHQGMAAMTTCYVFVVLTLGLRVHRTILRTFQLEHTNRQLVDRVTAANQELELANQELNQKVQERTSELKATLAEKLTSESRLARVHTLLEFANLGILVADPSTLVLVDHNRPALELLELSPEELEGKLLTDLPFGRQVEGEFLELGDGLPRVKLWGELELTFCRRTREDSDCLLVLIRDVAERLKWERNIRQSQKMQAVGRLAGEMAHDFNNILMAISGFAGLLSEELPETSQARADARQVLLACERGQSLTGQLLSFSADKFSEPRVVDLNTHLRELDQMLRRLLGESIEVVTLLSEQECPVSLDLQQFDQVMLNLTLNAREAMGGQGVLTLSVEREEEAVTVEVRDTGPGVSEEVREHIFEPFFTTRAQRGTGLGLATSFGLVARAGGELSLVDDGQPGACFRIRLPLSQQPLARPRVSEAKAPTTCDGRRILVVEDQEAVLSVVCRGLERYGYRVSRARSGEEALALLEGEHDFELVVSDVVLPKMSGLEVHRRLAAQPHTPPFLMISGYVDEATDNIGPDSPPLLRKPFLLKELVAAVEDNLG